MATTSILSANMIQKLWAKQLYADVMADLYFENHGFIGEGPGSIIQKKTELSKQAGDTITFGLTYKLSGNGVSGDSTLEGSEEAITGHDMSVTVNQLRNGVRLAGRMEEQKAPYNMRQDAKDKLKTWMSEKIEKTFFTTLGTSPSSTRRVLTSADHSSIGTLDNTDLVTCEFISRAKRVAQLASPKIRPVRIKGKDHFVLVLHPYAARDLKKDSTWLAAQEYANVRGEDNPLFSGAIGMWDGVIVHEHDMVLTGTDGAASARVGYNLFLGQQAGVWAVAEEPYWREKEFDYENQIGFATGIIHGFAKTTFNSVDYGMVTIVSSAAAD